VKAPDSIDMRGGGRLVLAASFLKMPCVCVEGGEGMRRAGCEHAHNLCCCAAVGYVHSAVAAAGAAPAGTAASPVPPCSPPVLHRPAHLGLRLVGVHIVLLLPVQALSQWQAIPGARDQREPHHPVAAVPTPGRYQASQAPRWCVCSGAIACCQSAQCV
jgi:hypothetical protein